MSTKDEAMTVSPNGQQTACYTALEFLQQMLNKEQKDFGEHYFITDEVREKMLNIKNIQSVIQLIKERQANAVEHSDLRNPSQLNKHHAITSYQP